jgi:peptidoglycan-associated lipoprotein
MANPNVRASIEGHCDERGTREYNQALGERRANAVRDYLLSQGVPASRLVTTSWGKERPVATGSNEEAWAQNRRAVTVIIR